MQLVEPTRVFGPTRPPESTPREPQACRHCGLEVPPARGDAFCCAGCASVHALLAAQGLTRFYDLGGARGIAVGPVPAPSRREWVAELEAGARDGVVRVVLDVQGIHCAACVWVIQELWRRRAGGVSIRINPALGQAELSYRPATQGLGGFLDDVERLGYRMAPASKRTGVRDRSLLVRMGVCIALAMNAMMFALAEYTGMTAADATAYPLFRALTFVLATASVAIGGSVFFRAAIAGLRRRVLHLDVPIALGIALAWSGSTFAWLTGAGEPYFDTVAVFVALMLVGRYLQHQAVLRNRAYLLADDGLAHVRVRRLSDAGVALVSVDAVRVGDTLLLTPGDLVPVAVRLIDGPAACSLDWINGESEPHAFAAGEAVPAGAFLATTRPVRALATGDARTSGLLALLAGSRSDREDLGVHASFWRAWNRVYVPIVLALALAGAACWMIVDPTRAIAVAVAVLVVTCPCAIGIATPLAMDLAIAGLRRRGVLVCSAGLLSKARHVRKVLLDKTGTLTFGGVTVDVVRPPRPELRDVLLSLAAGSNHPVSRAIVEVVGATGPFAYLEGLAPSEVAGSGVEAIHRGDLFRLGSATFAGGGTDDTSCRFTRNGVIEAEFRVREDLRTTFATELPRLAAIGCEVHVLSGDRQAKVDRLAATIGVPRARAHGDLTPQAKAEYVTALDDADTMMLGDGLNDAPAFAAAYVAGTPALDRPVLPARADFCYAGGRPEAIGDVIVASRVFHRVVRTNLALGIGYNGIAVTLCLLGVMTPVLCAVLMPISSLALILHTTVRLRRTGRTSMESARP